MKLPGSQPTPSCGPPGFAQTPFPNRTDNQDHPEGPGEKGQKQTTLTRGLFVFIVTARAEVAQSVEQRPEKPRVGSSILHLGTNMGTSGQPFGISVSIYTRLLFSARLKTNELSKRKSKRHAVSVFSIFPALPSLRSKIEIP
jgi:hypothetical protein